MTDENSETKRALEELQVRKTAVENAILEFERKRKEIEAAQQEADRDLAEKTRIAKARADEAEELARQAEAKQKLADLKAPVWKRPGVLASLTTIIGVSITAATAVGGWFQKERDRQLEQLKIDQNVQLERWKLRQTIAATYADKVGNPASRQLILTFLRDASGDAEIKAWATSEIAANKEAFDAIDTAIKATEKKVAETAKSAAVATTPEDKARVQKDVANNTVAVTALRGGAGDRGFVMGAVNRADIPAVDLSGAAAAAGTPLERAQAAATAGRFAEVRTLLMPRVKAARGNAEEARLLRQACKELRDAECRAQVDLAFPPAAPKFTDDNPY